MVSETFQTFPVIYKHFIYAGKRLYQRVFEYDTPLFHTGICKYEFIAIEESEYDNPWKESFKQLNHGVHIRPGFQEKAGKRLLNTHHATKVCRESLFMSVD